MCYPSCALFSAPSCAVSILNGAPSSAPAYFLFKVGLPHYWFKEFFCVTHRVHFFLHHRVQMFTFYLKVVIPQFAAEKISFCFKYVLCYPSFALFSAPSCAVIIFIGAPSSAPVYFYLWDASFPWCKNFLVLNIFCVTHRVHFSLPHRVQLVFLMVSL